MDLPRITIVTPSFNQGQFLEQTIKSVLSQNYPNLDYIIMDGGSEDNSVAIIKRYADRFSYWQSESDNGQADAVARGFEMATGEIFGWLNSDDLLMPHALQNVAQAFTNNPDSCFITGTCIYIDSNSIPFKLHVPRQKSFSDMLIFGYTLAQMSTFWKKSAYEEVGGIDSKFTFAFDYDLFLRLRKKHDYMIIPDSLAMFRIHPVSKTSTLYPVSIKEDQSIRKKHLAPENILLKCAPFLTRLDPVRRLKNRMWWHKSKKHYTKLCSEYITALSQNI